MDKLIELLLEYKPQIHYLDKPKGIYNKKYGIGWYKRKGDIGGWFSEGVIISKRFGFIKRLIDNDKIDLESYCRITSVERKGEKDVYRDEVDSLIMLLAIQDNPIEFLISILK